MPKSMKRLFLVLFCLPVLLSGARSQDDLNNRIDLVVQAARSQIGVTIYYDGSYQSLSYPGGDVSIDRGVCTDVIIRSLRAANLDLQVLVHEDIKNNFDDYPNHWGMTGPDANIDHRRVPNLMKYFSRQDLSVSISTEPEDYKTCDIVAWQLSPGIHHIGIVADTTILESGNPLIVHNIGAGVQLEDILFLYKIIGHYRVFKFD